MAIGHFEIKKARNGRYHFELKASNGEIILTSELYATKASAENGISSVQHNAPEETQYEIKQSSTNQPYFVLKARNYQVIGISELYSSVSAARHGILAVTRHGTSTDIRDLTH
ncbi:YegP family protein [Nissabacter sp. SGAir0207]|uniref:YegP family protein n=1 Tax=Nissabacter sp. SGAir0207 TaxID=2126321 RepID=UPI0010CD5932|nr:YegP family protein [Nissabacter sp. SGAir0207]QCR35317.1 hypothetical protein C1N62_04050 [Nissabacter sp. SGAir0207]